MLVRGSCSSCFHCIEKLFGAACADGSTAMNVSPVGHMQVYKRSPNSGLSSLCIGLPHSFPEVAAFQPWPVAAPEKSLEGHRKGKADKQGLGSRFLRTTRAFWS